ncbi:hypothetical protein ABW19_dt0202695 [Dactylella cylindrospora]|nr:hypothetical protein ABW19_dt0202695 [Dactylella cylindrospora]
MRCFKPHRPPNLCRTRSLSTSSAQLAAATLRVDTHSTSSVSVGCCLADPAIRVVHPPSTQRRRTSEPSTWMVYKPLPPPLLVAPGAGVAVERAVLGLSYPRSEGSVAEIPLVESTRTNGMRLVSQQLQQRQEPRVELMDGFLLSSEDGKSGKDKDQVSERKLNLGKTIDILKDRLPTLLQSPLPSEILSPSITLQLFPSTHPHLPTVRGRMAYIAALWTSPVVWGRIPGIKVRLEILSVKMTKGGMPLKDLDDGDSSEIGGEQMIVKWRASSSPNGSGNGKPNGAQSSKPTSPSKSTPTTTLSKESKEDPLAAITSSIPKITTNGDFCGLFIFEFDDAGKIKTHIIEDVEEDRGESRQQHSKVITLTEWLLKKAKGSLEDKPPMPGLAFERLWQGGGDRRGERFS